MRSSARRRSARKRDAQAKRVAALRDVRAAVAAARSTTAYASYLEVLYAENELFGAELTAVRSLRPSATRRS